MARGEAYKRGKVRFTEVSRCVRDLWYYCREAGLRWALSAFIHRYLSVLIFLHSAPSTLAILGMPLSEKHDGFCNKRVLQDAVRAGKEKEAPAGFQWNGMDMSFLQVLLIN